MASPREQCAQNQLAYSSNGSEMIYCAVLWEESGGREEDSVEFFQSSSKKKQQQPVIPERVKYQEELKEKKNKKMFQHLCIPSPNS